MTEGPRYEAIIRSVLAAVDHYLPTELPFDENTQATTFALAAIRRMADLIDAELRLALQDRHSVTRVLGRSVTELWLYANELLLDGQAALDRLFDEDAAQQARLQDGRRKIWERLESHREGGVMLHDPDFVPGEDRVRANVEALAGRVRQFRDERGIGGGIAEVRYQMQYRNDSAFDVHVGADLLFRYVDLEQGDLARVLKEPVVDRDVHEFRGWDSVYNDAGLLTDVLGLYLGISGRLDELEELACRVNGA